MISLVEGDSPAVYELTAEQAAALAATTAVRVGPGPRAGLWKVRDNGYVGAAVIGGVEVRITPKTPVDRVFFLLGYARRPSGWRQEEVNAGEHAELLPAIAHAYAMAADRALRQGVLQGYLEMEEALPVIRGRIREADQIRRRYGLPLPVEVRYDDYTVDIAENRLLLAASARLLRLPGLAIQTRKTLRHVIARLAGITALVPGRPLPAWLPSRINTRYHTALGLAELVLRGASYELDDGTAVRVNGLLVEMWRVFEDFVTVALSEALRPHGGRSELQDKRHHLDHGSGCYSSLTWCAMSSTPGVRRSRPRWSTASTRSRPVLAVTAPTSTRCWRTARRSASIAAIWCTPRGGGAVPACGTRHGN